MRAGRRSSKSGEERNLAEGNGTENMIRKKNRLICWLQTQIIVVSNDYFKKMVLL